MAPKNSNNSERKTRNSSRGRSPAKGVRSALSNSTNANSQNPDSLSPSRDEVLPDGKVNKVGIQAKASSESLVLTPKAINVDSVLNAPISTTILANAPGEAALLSSFISSSTQTEKASGEVSDDKEGSHSGLSDVGNQDPKVHTEKTLLFVLAELKEIKSSMGAIHKIEETTATFSKELSVISGRTADLEEAFEATSARVKELGDDVSTLKSAAQKQERSMSSLQKMKEEISTSNDKRVEEMKNLIEGQKEQAEALQSSVETIKQDLSASLTQDLSVALAAEIDKKLEKKFDQLAQESHFQSLREQAFNKRFNLIITGLAEDDQQTTADLLSKFLETNLNLKNIEFKSATRVGPTTDDPQSYIRPILVNFGKINHRNRVWRKRHVESDESGEHKVRIQADLPKELKEGIQMLYRVAKAASNTEQFRSAKVFNYQLEINGVTYQPSQLEELPYDLRPSTLSSPRSGTCLAFFSRSSILSNHYPAEFIIDNQKYFNVEHYLAVKRAAFSNQPQMIRKANSARDPRQAKYVLNALKEDRPEEWYGGIEPILLDGLKAKFSQNPAIASFLIDTDNLLLGEASKDDRWGIGMTLNDPQVLDSSLWNPEGNLLGRSLMKIRAELAWRPPPPTSSPPT